MASKSKAIRVYADTSVYGGVFDREFAAASRRFFEEVRRGRFCLLVSAVVRDEIAAAPKTVVDFFDTLRPVAEEVPVTGEAVALQQSYIQAGVVGDRWQADALHVALATVAGCDLIVSWNFKHIVHFDKIGGYNAVNKRDGYGVLGIHAPPEVTDENDS